MIIIINSGSYFNTNGLNGVLIADPVTPIDTEELTITFNEISVTGIYQTGNISIFEGDSIDLSFSQIEYTYQWYFDDSIMVGETDPVLVIPSFSVADEGEYKISLTNPNNSQVSFFGPISLSL